MTQSQFTELLAALPHKLPLEYTEHIFKLIDKDGEFRTKLEP